MECCEVVVIEDVRDAIGQHHGDGLAIHLVLRVVL